MDELTESQFDKLESADKNDQFAAFDYIMTAITQPVDWAYEIWEQLKTDLVHRDSHRRSRAAQFLAGLAISDPEQRIVRDFAAVWEVTRDPRFVTARHSLQSIWRIGLAGQQQLDLALGALASRFRSCAAEKNGGLIRFDIMDSLKKLYDATGNDSVRQTVAELIELEQDDKNRKKLEAVWKVKPG